MPRDDKLHSGFIRKDDYVFTFSIEDPERRARMVALCAGPWQGDEVTPNTWEISNELSPDQMESAIVANLGENDRAAYYYLADSKRIFRVMLG